LLAKLGIREQARSHDGAPAMCLRATLFRNFGVVVLVGVDGEIIIHMRHLKCRPLPGAAIARSAHQPHFPNG